MLNLYKKISKYSKRLEGGKERDGEGDEKWEGTMRFYQASEVGNSQMPNQESPCPKTKFRLECLQAMGS